MRMMPFIDNPTGDPQEKVQKLEQQYKSADALRRKFEPDMYENILFLAGNQWDCAHEDIRRFRKITVRPPQSKVKVVMNHIYPLARQAAASLREHIAKQEAIPSTMDESDVQAAELGTDFIDARHYEDEEDDKRFREILWSMVAGQCMRMTYWDPDKASEGITGRVNGMGDIESTTLNPFRYHLCPWADDNGKMPWIIVSDVRDIDEINDIYPGKDVQAEEYADAMRYLDKLAVNIVEQTEQTTEKRNHAAILKRLYMAPTPKYPNGKVWTWAGGIFLAESELPEGEMPFVDVSWFYIPGRVYPLPFVTPLRPMQKEINITLSQLIEVKNRQLRGDMVVQGTGEVTQEVLPSGSKIIKLEPGIQDFKLMEYNLQATEAEILLNNFVGIMKQASGINDPSSGEASPSGTTATEVAMLKESDMTGLSLFRTGFDISYCKVSRQKLLLARNHYKLPRMLRVVGEQNAVKTAAFYGSDLRSTEDVRPITVPILTETMKMQMRQQAVGAGLFGPYAGPEDMLAKMDGLIATGIPNIKEEIDARLAPMTYEELQKIVAAINAEKSKAALLAAKAQTQAIAAQMQAMSVPQGEQTDEMGNPLEGAGEPMQPPEQPMQQPEPAGTGVM